MDVEAEVAKYTSKQQELKQQDRTGLRGAFNAGFERIFGKDRVVGNEALRGCLRLQPPNRQIYHTPGASPKTVRNTFWGELPMAP